MRLIEPIALDKRMYPMRQIGHVGYLLRPLTHIEFNGLLAESDLDCSMRKRLQLDIPLRIPLHPNG
jgi:hypothetical protein